MKYIIVLFVLFFIFNQANDLSGQFKGEFSIGPEIKFNYFQIYSKSDWNNKPISYAIMDNSPNGKSIGISAEYNFSNHYGLKAGLLYSNQYQKYLRSYSSGIFETKIKTKLQYFNLPIQTFFYKEIFNNSNLYFKGYIGFQLSYSINYSTEFNQYYIDKNLKINYDSVTNHIIIKPYLVHQRYIDYKNEVEINETKTNYLFKKILIGVISNFSIEKYYMNKFKFILGLDIQYTLNQTEEYGGEKFWYGYVGQCALGGRCKSHNRSLGLSFTIQYLLNPQSYYK